MKQILTESIRIDGETQSRAQIDQQAVEEYAESMKAGTKFPPVVVFRDGTEYWCADGFHRVLAARRAGIKHLAAEVKQGGRAEAAWCASGANLTHGIRRSNADKRKAVTLALNTRSELSDSAIADHCGVSHTFVAEIRRQVATVATCQPPPMRMGRDGKLYPLPPQRPPAERIAPPPDRRLQAPGTPARPPPPTDELGRRIPEALQPLWARRDEVKALLAALSRVRVSLRNSQEVKDRLMVEVPYTATLAHLDQAYNGVQVATPYAVCPFCQGQGCRACCQRGLLSKHRWDMTVPRDLKKQVEALVAEERGKSS